jgi:hypothetical protein
VDFKGGDSLLLSFEKKVPLDQLRTTVETLVKESRVGYQKSLSGGSETLSVVVPEDQGEALRSSCLRPIRMPGCIVLVWRRLVLPLALKLRLSDQITFIGDAGNFDLCRHAL